MHAYIVLLLVVPDYGVDKYDIGTGFGHFGIAVEDVSLCHQSFVSSSDHFWFPSILIKFYNRKFAMLF